MFFKGFCPGFFYTFLSIGAMIFISSLTIEKGEKMGGMVSLGLSVIESLYSLLAFLILLGATFFVRVENPFCIFLAALFLFFMAVQVYRNQNGALHGDQLNFSKIKLLSYSFFTTFLTPIRVLGYTAIFICLKVHPDSVFALLLLSFSVFFGSFLWWIFYITSMRKTEKEGLVKAAYRLHRCSFLALALFSFIGVFQLLL